MATESEPILFSTVSAALHGALQTSSDADISMLLDEKYSGVYEILSDLWTVSSYLSGDSQQSDMSATNTTEFQHGGILTAGQGGSDIFIKIQKAFSHLGIDVTMNGTLTTMPEILSAVKAISEFKDGSITMNANETKLVHLSNDVNINVDSSISGGEYQFGIQALSITHDTGSGISMDNPFKVETSPSCKVTADLDYEVILTEGPVLPMSESDSGLPLSSCIFGVSDNTGNLFKKWSGGKSSEQDWETAIFYVSNLPGALCCYFKDRYGNRYDENNNLLYHGLIKGGYDFKLSPYEISCYVKADTVTYEIHSTNQWGGPTSIESLRFNRISVDSEGNLVTKYEKPLLNTGYLYNIPASYIYNFQFDDISGICLIDHDRTGVPNAISALGTPQAIQMPSTPSHTPWGDTVIQLPIWEKVNLAFDLQWARSEVSSGDIITPYIDGYTSQPPGGDYKVDIQLSTGDISSFSLNGEGTMGSDTGRWSYYSCLGDDTYSKITITDNPNNYRSKLVGVSPFVNNRYYNSPYKLTYADGKYKSLINKKVRDGLPDYSYQYSWIYFAMSPVMLDLVISADNKLEPLLNFPQLYVSPQSYTYNYRHDLSCEGTSATYEWLHNGEGPWYIGTTDSGGLIKYPNIMTIDWDYVFLNFYGETVSYKDAFRLEGSSGGAAGCVLYGTIPVELYSGYSAGNYLEITIGDKGVVGLTSLMPETYGFSVRHGDDFSETLIDLKGLSVSKYGYEYAYDLSVDRMFGAVWNDIDYVTISGDPEIYEITTKDTRVEKWSYDTIDSRYVYRQDTTIPVFPTVTHGIGPNYDGTGCCDYYIVHSDGIKMKGKVTFKRGDNYNDIINYLSNYQSEGGCRPQGYEFSGLHFSDDGSEYDEHTINSTDVLEYCPIYAYYYDPMAEKPTIYIKLNFKIEYDDESIPIINSVDCYGKGSGNNYEWEKLFRYDREHYNQYDHKRCKFTATLCQAEI